MDPRERLIVALDRSERDQILPLADELQGAAGMLKIGLQAFVANGPSIVGEIVERGHRLFLDLKFHDIPNTARNAVAEARQLGVAMTNVHAAGGAAMMRACREEMPRGSGLLIAVTALTSLDDEACEEIGFQSGVADVVRRLARLTRESGLDGVVASPQEIRLIREECGEDFAIVTPGIRGAAEARGDQKRTMSAGEAVAAGATYIVVGRPVTDSPVPREAALRIVDSIEAGWRA